MTAFATPLEFLAESLEKVRAWLARYALLHAERFVKAPGQLKDRTGEVTLPELRATLAGKLNIVADAAEIDGWLADFDRRMAERLAESADLPVERLRRRFGLSSLDLDILLAVVAPEIDLSIGRAYDFVVDDASRRAVDVALLCGLLSRDEAEADAVRERLSDDAPLSRWSLVEVADSSAGRSPFLLRRVRLPDRVLDFLRGRAVPTARSRGPGIDLLFSPRLAEEAIFAEGVKEGFARAISHLERRGGLPRIALVGADGAGKRSLAETTLVCSGRPMLYGDLTSIAEDLPSLPGRLRWMAREAQLQEAVLYLDHAELLDKIQPDVVRVHALHALGHFEGLVCLGFSEPPTWQLAGWVEMVRFDVPNPGRTEMERLWARHLGRISPPPGEDVLPAELARQHGLTGEGIARVAKSAAALAAIEGGERIAVRHVDAALRGHLNQKLSALADPVPTTFSWDDLVIPEDVAVRLREIAVYGRQRETVYDAWGLRRKFPYGRGISALFSGPPGTGKTMAATIIARDLRMPLYRIDLSRIVDRYVGETEKNIRRVFDAATDGHGVLLFDEADALFAKRTEVKSANDRYANLEVNYLLQQMESFEGVTILTTNADASIDEAFKRRLRFRIHFPFPDRDERVALWRSMLPEAEWVDEGIDLRRVASNYEMTGGMIKNAVLRAAFIAADTKRRVDTALLLESAEIEFAEMGHLARKAM